MMWYLLTGAFPTLRNPEPGRPRARVLCQVASVWFTALSFNALAAESVDWTGVWETQWRGGGAVMELQQDGERVVGRYPGFDGQVEGRIEGNQLSGTWSDTAVQGVFTFVMSPDQKSFMGRFGTGEWWTGLRSHTKTQQTLFGAVDDSSAEQTLLSFLQAGNRAGEGRSDRLSVVLPLLDFSAFEEPLTLYDRIDLARLLFQILDRLTLRLWELNLERDSVEPGEYTVNLNQAGTNFSYSLRLRTREEAGDADPRS